MVATGIPGLIHGDMLKPGCAIIDVGINRVKNPKTGKTYLSVTVILKVSYSVQMDAVLCNTQWLQKARVKYNVIIINGLQGRAK